MLCYFCCLCSHVTIYFQSWSCLCAARLLGCAPAAPRRAVGRCRGDAGVSGIPGADGGGGSRPWGGSALLPGISHSHAAPAAELLRGSSACSKVAPPRQDPAPPSSARHWGWSPLALHCAGTNNAPAWQHCPTCVRGPSGVSLRHGWTRHPEPRSPGQEQAPVVQVVPSSSLGWGHKLQVLLVGAASPGLSQGKTMGRVE